MPDDGSVDRPSVREVARVQGAGDRLARSSGACASIVPMISGDRAAQIERQLAQLLAVEVDELRDYFAGNIRTSTTRRTGFRFVRGTHGGHYVRDRDGTDIAPAGVVRPLRPA